MRYPEERQKAVDWAVNYLTTQEARKTLKERAIFAEWAIAEGKTLHGLRRVFYRGLEKVSIQALLTASVQNIKRLLRHQRDRITQVLLPILQNHKKPLWNLWLFLSNLIWTRQPLLSSKLG